MSNNDLSYLIAMATMIIFFQNLYLEDKNIVMFTETIMCIIVFLYFFISPFLIN